MKTFSFVSGTKVDASRSMALVIDRRALPTDMKLGLWIDDDGKQLRNVDRPATRGGAQGGFGIGEVVFLERTRLRTRIGALDGVLTLEAGSRFESVSPGRLTALSVQGGEIREREGRRFADFNAPIGALRVERTPNEPHVFTIEAEKPAGAKAGERFVVHIAQKDETGVTVGGVTAVFVFG